MPSNRSTLPLLCAALIGACERPGPEHSSSPASQNFQVGASRSGNASCGLPRGDFAPSLQTLTGTRLGHPIDRVDIDRTGHVSWNGVAVEASPLSRFIANASADPATFIVIRSDLDAPCATVRDTLATAVRIGRCNRERCAFEWLTPSPPAPPPPLPAPPPPPPPPPTLPGLVPLSEADIRRELASGPSCALSDGGSPLLVAVPDDALVNHRGRLVHLKPPAKGWSALVEGGRFAEGDLVVEIDVGAIVSRPGELVERDTSVSIVRRGRGFNVSHGPRWICRL